MTTEFSAFNLRPELEQAITALGYVEPTPIQAGIIPLMLTGADVIGQAQTGTGKTAAFALPILNNLQPASRAPQALVMAPTRELALQVAEATSSMGQFCKVRVLAVYGGAPYIRQINELRRGVDVVVGTPGRLIDLMERGVLDLGSVRTVVLDEADEMLSMGFIEDIETILAATPVERQTALFSATMPTPIRRLADKYMREPQPVTIDREQMTVAATEQRYYLVNEREKTAALTRLFEMEEISSALIFVRTRAGTGELANELSTRGFPSEALNGDLNQDARERTLNRFRGGQIKVLVATDVAARGLDIDDISHVFNYDLPDDAEIYVHRIGRTGRAGKTGIAISLVPVFEKRRVKDIERFTRSKLTLAKIPTTEEIIARREAELTTQITVWLARGRCKTERAIVEKLVETGVDPLEIAAVALKIARGDEKQRPIAPITELNEIRPARPVRGGGVRRDFAEKRPFSEKHSLGTEKHNPDRPARIKNHEGFPGAKFGMKSNEPGMVRLTMSLGKMDGIRPSDVVGAIAYHADIPGNTIGKIYIEDQHTLVDVPEQFVGQVLSKTGKYSIRRQAFTVEKA
ncbi:MAG TPA: DEAD/DEAH box helicase [Anaerolineales bacterium]|jgi:ATP-dependent RNA helicase DeaD